MDILNEFLSRLPLKRKSTPSGWLCVNAVCCHHRGHRADRRLRGGFKTTGNNAFSYSCFNCGYKASWAEGRTLSKPAKQLLEWLGASQDEIKKINFYCLKNKSETPIAKTAYDITNKAITLPKDAKPFSEWAENPPEDFLRVLEYMNDRNPRLLDWWKNYYWTPDKEHHMNKRVIVPYTSKNDNFIYGYAARGIDKKIQPKYMCSVINNAYLFNQDVLYMPHRKYIIVCEGIFDAISIDGAAVMKQYLTENQIATLKTVDKEKKIIVVPDRDNSGKKLVEQALELGYAVSFPNWGEGIKDIADAAARYGRLITMKLILNSVETYDVKIKLKMKGWFDV